MEIYLFVQRSISVLLSTMRIVADPNKEIASWYLVHRSPLWLIYLSLSLLSSMLKPRPTVW